MGFFQKIKQGLQKTRDSLMNPLNSLFRSFTKIDEELFEELEEIIANPVKFGGEDFFEPLNKGAEKFF